MVPDSLDTKRLIIQAMHDHPLAGHFSFLSYRVPVHSYQARKPSKTPDEPEVRRNKDLI